MKELKRRVPLLPAICLMAVLSASGCSSYTTTFYCEPQINGGRALNVVVVCLAEKNLKKLNQIPALRGKLGDKSETDAIPSSISADDWFNKGLSESVKGKLDEDAYWEVTLGGGTIVTNNPNFESGDDERKVVTIEKKLKHPGPLGKRAGVLILARFVKSAGDGAPSTDQLFVNSAWGTRHLEVSVGNSSIEWKNP